MSALAVKAQGDPIISEFMADNKTVLADEDGMFSDWIEIYNPDAAPVDLAGWHLTDNATKLNKWTFPSVMLEPGGFLMVFASSKNKAVAGHELHTNFSLSKEGEYLALIKPDGSTKASQFAPSFPSQSEDVSFGFAFNAANFISSGANTKYQVPPNAANDATWITAGFNDASWSGGTTGLGFGLLEPGITVTEIRSASSNLTNLAAVDSLLSGVGASQTDVRIRATINFLGEGADGHFGANQPFVIGGSYHLARGAGYLVIPAAGTYTFGISSDDGSRLRIDLNNDGDFNDAGEGVIIDDTNHGVGDHFGTVTFAAAGNYLFESLFFQNTGGDEFEFFAAPGTKTVFDSTFALVGDTEAGGLQAMSAPGSAAGGGAIIGTNVQSVMQNVRSSLYSRIPFNVAAGTSFDLLSLGMRYNDGFVAWLNGTELVRRNAPVSVDWQSAATSARDNLASLTTENINLTANRSLLHEGTNVLAIQGLNISAADNSFLVLPELRGGTFLGTTQAYFFTKATPGSLNSTPTSLGFLEDTKFSVKRGVYSAPISLHITCATPGSTIRYTLDGSEPGETNGTAVPAPDANSPADATLSISTTTVIRAAAFKTGYTPSNVDTNSYLFFGDVIQQSNNPINWPAPGNAINGQQSDYAMDPNIVNNASPTIGGPDKVIASLNSLPSVCLSLPVSSLMDATTGIYVNAYQDGFAWERPASLEMINDPNTEERGFQVRCGLRIRGGYSRSEQNPKHGFRIFFRSDYGAGKLNYPIFAGDDFAATEFDKFDLNCAQNYSWSFEGSNANLFLRDQWVNDAQLAMGAPSQHNRYIHLFINGLYWGVYGIQERPEADFAASYRGGSKTDYDVVKSEAGPYTINPTDGDLNAWQDMWNKSRACYFINKDLDPITHADHTYTVAEKNAAYFKMIGRAADGITPTSDPILLGENELIDYMLLAFLSGNTDAPLSAFLENNRPNNFFALRDRRGGSGFFYVAHDSEHTFDAPSAAADRTGPFNDPITGTWNDFTVSNAQFTHQDLAANKEYQMRFADRVFKHLVDSKGVLTAAANQARLAKRAAQLEVGMVGESARWGDSRTTPARTLVDWTTTKNNLLNNYFPSRNNTLLSQLRADGLYPSVNPPVMVPNGGMISSSTQVGMTSGAGTVYFTVNGADPRMVGGAVNPSAQVYIGGNPTTVTLIDTGADWKFRDDGVDLGTAWKEASYADAAWTKHGPSRLGFGEAVNGITDATTVSFVDADPVTAGIQKNITTYFRRSFTVTDPAGFLSVTLQIARDDGCVVYLNGKELGRSNMPLAPAVITSTTLAPANINTQALALAWNTIPVAITDFVSGTNVLAVEVHQNASNSPDLGFDLRLTTQQLSSGTPISMNIGVNKVRARLLDAGGNWSALNEQEFLVDAQVAATSNLIVSELMYHPTNPSVAEANAGFLSDQEFQWIELRNIGNQTIDLRGAYFFDGITYVFPDSGPITTLPSGGRILLVENIAAFQFRYGHNFDAMIAGEFSGALDHGGERLLLKNKSGNVILDFTYGDSSPWPTAADGTGYSLTYAPSSAMTPGVNTPASDPSNWRSSTLLGGTPASIEPINTFAAWKLLHSITSASGDEDGDGISNLYEYAAGTNPRQVSVEPLLTLELQADPSSGTQIANLQFRRNLSADDLVWTVEVSNSTNGTWLSNATSIPTELNNGDGIANMTCQIRLPITELGPRYFARVRVAHR